MKVFIEQDDDVKQDGNDGIRVKFRIYDFIYVCVVFVGVILVNFYAKDGNI